MPQSIGSFQNDHAEIWKDGPIIRLLYRSKCDLDLSAQKDVIQLLGLIDPANKLPLLVELGSQVMIHKEAREFAHRYSNMYRRPAIALLAHELSDKMQANFYAHVHKPRTPFKVFYRLADAEEWLLKSQEVFRTVVSA